VPRLVSAAFAVENAKRAGAVRVDFLEADFGQPDPGFFRLWTGVGVKTWGGHDFWSGLGLVLVRPGAEKADGSTDPTTFSLALRDRASGADFVAAAMGAKTGGLVRVWRGWLVPTGGAVVAEPLPRSIARISNVRVEESPAAEGAAGPVVVSVSAEMVTANQDRSQRFRITNASQLEFDPTDRGLIYQATNEPLLWGDLFYKKVKND
jgi:hypothetical protein